jgi:hypothetical protein
MSVFSGVPGCVSLAARIVDLLLTSQNNKHEYRSLQSAVDNIKEFLTALPQEGITQQGNNVLSEYQQQQQLHACHFKQALYPVTANRAPCMMLGNSM